MDITYKSDEGRFNFRIAALFIESRELLVMKDERSPYFYLPGGRVRLHETTEEAVKREMLEELGLSVEVQRLAWVAESFFREDVSGERFHELAFYYVVDFSKIGLLHRGKAFVMNEGGLHRLEFSWKGFDELRNLYFYPAFLKSRVADIPQTAEHIVMFE